MNSSATQGRPLPEGRPRQLSSARLFTFFRIRRRRYVIDWRYQVRAGLLTLGIVVVLLVLLNLSLYEMSRARTEVVVQALPEMQPALQETDRFQLLFMLGSSLLFALGTLFLVIPQGHKMAGAAFNLRRCLRSVQDGRYGILASLRREDALQELASAFNEMTRTLEHRTRKEIETLEALADTAGRVPCDPVAVELTTALSGLIEEKRRAIED